MKRIFHANSKRFVCNKFIFAFWLFLFAANASVAAPPKLTEISDDYLLVVELNYQSLVLEESLFIFHTPEYTLVPLQALIDILDFPLEIDLDNATIDGWFIKEQNTLALNIPKREVYIRGQKQPWPKSFRYTHDGFDLYIDLHSLKSWLGLSAQLDVSQLKLALQSDSPLPIIQQKLRETNRKKIKKHKLERVTSFIPNEYDWVGAPSFDLELSYDVTRTKPTDQQAHQVLDAYSGSIQGVADLAKHSLRTSYTKQEDAQDLRLTLSKSAPEPGTTIIPGIDSYDIGDINTHSDNLIFNSVSGIGIKVSKGSNALQEQSQSLILEGDAPPGWEVELYRNGTLIDFANTSADGQYEFSGIDTYLGENVFDIRIYGPQGQYRSSQKRVHVGNKMLKLGDWNQQSYWLKKNRKLIGETSTKEEKTHFFHSEALIGINEQLSGSVSISKLTPDNTTSELSYFSASLHGSVFDGLMQLTSATSTESGSAHFLSFKSRWQDLNYNLELKKFNHLVTDINPSNNIQSEFRLNGNGIIRNLLPWTVSYDLELDNLNYRNQSRQWSLKNRLSTRILQTQIAHNLNYTYTKFTDSSKNSSDASLSLTKRYKRLRSKLEANYKIHPTLKLSAVTASANYKADKNLSLLTTASFTKGANNIASIDSTVSWRFKPAALSLGIGLNNQNQQSFHLSLNTTLGYKHSDRTLYLDTSNSSADASVTAHAFIDNNNNGTYEATIDDNIENLQFKGKSTWKKVQTNQQGLVTLNGIPSLSMQKIEVDTRSLEDPFLHSTHPYQHLYSHSGKHTFMSFPFLPMLDVEGEMLVETDKRSSVMPGIALSLINTLSGEAYQTTTEYDGIFLFSGVVPGNYILSVSSDDKRLKGFILPPPQNVHIAGHEGVVYIDTIKAVSQP